MISSSLKSNLTIGTVILSILKFIASNESLIDNEQLKIDLSKKADLIYVIEELSKYAEKTQIPILNEGDVIIGGESIILQKDLIIKNNEIIFKEKYKIFYDLQENDLYFKEIDNDEKMSLTEIKNVYTQILNNISRNRINIYDLSEDINQNYFNKNETYSKIAIDQKFVSNSLLEETLSNIELNNKAFTKQECTNIFLTRHEAFQKYLKKDIADSRYVSKYYLDLGYYNKNLLYTQSEINSKLNSFSKKTDVYLKSEVYNKSQVYNRLKIDDEINKSKNFILNEIEINYAKKNEYVSLQYLTNKKYSSKQYVDDEIFKIDKKIIDKHNEIKENYLDKQELETNYAKKDEYISSQYFISENNSTKEYFNSEIKKINDDLFNKFNSQIDFNFDVNNELFDLKQDVIDLNSSLNSSLNENKTDINNITEIADNIIVSTNIIPDSDEKHDLGSAEKKFRDLYLSGNTIFLGNNTIKNDSQNGISVDNLIIGNPESGQIKLSVSKNILSGKTSLQINEPSQNDSSSENIDLDELNIQLNQVQNHTKIIDSQIEDIYDKINILKNSNLVSEEDIEQNYVDTTSLSIKLEEQDNIIKQLQNRIEELESVINNN